jgi:hypothetical protein
MPTLSPGEEDFLTVIESNPAKMNVTEKKERDGKIVPETKWRWHRSGASVFTAEIKEGQH